GLRCVARPIDRRSHSRGRGGRHDWRAGGKRARRHARGSGNREQRRVELHQYRRGGRCGTCLVMSVKSRAYLDLARPFTLVAPALGFISGALTAVGAAPPEQWYAGLLVPPLIGSIMAACLNAGNNALNQIY